MTLTSAPQSPTAALQTVSDEEIARRVRAGETALFEVLMRRHNPRVYRAVRSIVRDEPEVEDLMQQVYLQAYAHLGQFEGQARFTTWLTRIAINEALMRVRKSGRGPVALAEPVESEEPDVNTPTPEELAQGRELAGLLEAAVDRLPEMYRATFMLREVEELSTSEAAEILGVTEEVVRSRLHRAKGIVRDALYEAIGQNAGAAFQFHATRCDRVVAGVMSRIRGA